MAKLKTYDEALEAQTSAKEAVKEAKKALTDYYKEHKLKRSKDYSKDVKHGKKIKRLEKDIDKANATLSTVNDQVKALKPSTGRKTKYDYPADCDTAEKRKKYRQEARAKAAGKTPRVKKAKKEDAPDPADKKAKKSKKAKKPSTKAAAVKKDKPAKRSKKRSKVEEDD